MNQQQQQHIIEIEGLIHRFSDGKQGIDGIHLTIRGGEFVIIAGANGSGKTTLLRHLNGLLIPHKGTVKIDGISVSDDLKRARRLVGMVFQDADSQIVGETVFDDVAFGPENLRLERSEIEDRVRSALNAVGMIHLTDQQPHLLSGGEKRRLAIAGILAMQSPIFVFDEPFSNLDYPGLCQLVDQIVRLHHAGHTVLLTTHDLEKVVSYADRLILLQQGKIVRDGTPVEILPDVEVYGVRQPCSIRFRKMARQ